MQQKCTWEMPSDLQLSNPLRMVYSHVYVKMGPEALEARGEGLTLKRICIDKLLFILWFLHSPGLQFCPGQVQEQCEVV